jgi:hypothetical protein
MAKARSGLTVKLTLQFTHILRTKKTRPRTPDCSGLPTTQPALPHRQVLHEGDQQMYRGYQQSQLIHFHDTRFNFRILANETGTRITTANRLHHSEPRTVSLDYLTNGTTRMPGKLPKVDGTSSTRIAKHPHLH